MGKVHVHVHDAPEQTAYAKRALNDARQAATVASISCARGAGQFRNTPAGAAFQKAERLIDQAREILYDAE